jgi:hypothetical protein
MTDEEIADLRKRIERVTKLLDDPHEGLFTWTHMLNAAWWGVVEWVEPEVILQNLRDLDQSSHLFKAPESMAHSEAHVKAISLLQEYSGKLWRDGLVERSVAIGDVIKGLEENDEPG